MAENDLQKNPLKILEYMGKEIITGFVDNLVKNNVVKLDEEEKKRFNNAERGDKPRVFVDAVRQKRHEAGQMLIQTFLNVDQKTNNNKVHLEPETRPAEWEESTDTLKLCSPEEFLRCCTERAGEIYPIQERNDRTRQALIICNIEFDHLTLREGADFDITGMKGLLEDLGYTVVVEKNLTASDMESVLKKFAAQPEHRSSDSTFLVLMSHGTLHGICGTTHSDKTPDVLVYDKIYQIFNNHKCRGLRDKPKVIIVQACRGGNPGEVWVRDSPAILTDSSSQSEKNLEADAVRLSHVEKDFIALYSTTPHNVSYRDPTKGSPFITQLVTCFQKYSWSCHILEIFVKVQQSFEKPSIESQMPTIERTTLSRYFYLFPGN